MNKRIKSLDFIRGFAIIYRHYVLLGFIVVVLYGLSSSILINIALSIMSVYLISVIIRTFRVYGMRFYRE